MSLILWESKIKFKIDLLTQIEIASERVTQDVTLHHPNQANLQPYV